MEPLMPHTVEGFKSSRGCNSLLFAESKKYSCTANPNSGNSIFQGTVANEQIPFFFFSLC